MKCRITAANNFSGQSAVTSRIFPVQLAGSVRKFNLNRPFICPILTFGVCPGNDYMGVEARDDVTLSLLQHRLNELGAGIKVELD